MTTTMPSLCPDWDGHARLYAQRELPRRERRHTEAGCAWCGGLCCDMHNRNCEPPSELCCQHCTEAAHGFLGRHTDGSHCIAPDLSGFVKTVATP